MTDATTEIIAKDIPAITVLAVSHEITIPDIPEVAGIKVPMLHENLAIGGLEPVGPVIFTYDGDVTSHDNVLKHTIAVPVDPSTQTQDAAFTNDFRIRELRAFKALSATHLGTMEKIDDAYERIYAYAAENSLALAGNHAREVYHNWIDFASPENVTEVLVALA
ncbi:GyrI-like domain-containing protein [Poriferisphaera sp. WC338]|uniref:GyrI-like domain-containing protein n=1 Tax=Poriferisphaera sp. WC338 TaxID=3425129 RepID=UPI003D81283C